MSDSEYHEWWRKNYNPFSVPETREIWDAAYAAGKEASPYRQVIDNALVCWGMVTTGNALADLNKLLVITQQVALDPLVCSDAQALINKGLERAAEICTNRLAHNLSKEIIGEIKK